jgi:hypothetical protein
MEHFWNATCWQIGCCAEVKIASTTGRNLLAERPNLLIQWIQDWA